MDHRCEFSDGSLQFTRNRGERLRIGEIDPRCVSASNELPKLTALQAAAHTWIRMRHLEASSCTPGNIQLPSHHRISARDAAQPLSRAW